MAFSYNKSNLATSTLTTGINSSATSITVSNATSFPDAPFFITLLPSDTISSIANSEIVLCTAKNSTTFTITRGQRGTTARAFSSGAIVTQGIYTQDLDYAQAVGKKVFSAELSGNAYVITDDMLPNTPDNGLSIRVVFDIDYTGSELKLKLNSGSAANVYVRGATDYSTGSFTSAGVRANIVYSLVYYGGVWSITNMYQKLGFGDIDYSTYMVNSLPNTGVEGAKYLVSAINYKISKLKGDTSQTTLTGKNLFGVADYTTNWGGGSSSCTNNEITISGTPTSNYIGIVPNNTALSTTIPAGTYTLRLNKTLPFTIYVNLVQTDNTTKWFTITPNATSYTNTLTAPATKVVSWSDMTGISGQTYNITGLQIQFEAGSTASSFEQYCGGVPSPNPSYPQFVNTATGLQTIEVVKDNLYNADDAQGYKWLDASTGQISNSNDPNVVSGYISTTVGTTYYISGTDQFKIRAFGYSDTTSNKAITYINYGETARSFTATYPYMRLAIGGGDAVSKISSFGVYASDDYQKYTINLGKNLCDGVNTNYWVGATTNMTYGRSTGNTGLILPVDSNTNYTISTTETQARYRLGLGDEALELNGSSTIYDKVLKDGTADSITLNSGSHKYLIVNATDLTKIQIERGSIATAYSEYFTPIELCKIGTYQDYIYKSGDDWYVHKMTKSIVLNGTENWTQTGGGIPYTDTITDYTKVAFTPYSNNFTGSPSVSQASLMPTNTIAFNTTADYIRFWVYYPDKWTTGSAVATWLTTHPTTVYYVLATPTDTQITNEIIIAQLTAIGAQTITVDDIIDVDGVIPVVPEQTASGDGYFSEYVYHNGAFTKVK